MSLPKIVSFRVPEALAEFSVIIDDGRIFRVRLNPLLMHENDSILVEVGNDCLFLIKEYSGESRQENSENILGEEIHVTPEVIGTLIAEPIDDNLILCETIQEGSSSTKASSSSLFNQLSSTLTTEMNKINERYHLTEQIQQVNEQYKITETISTTTRAIDEKYHVTETISTTTRAIDEKYHVTENVKSVANSLVDVTSSTSTLVMTQASTLNETYHVTENVKSVVGVVSSKVHEIDEKYHVTETVKGTAEVVVAKVNETLRSANEPSHEPLSEVDPDLDEETHFSS
jgi:septation ring formation regulator EzrA